MSEPNYIAKLSFIGTGLPLDKDVSFQSFRIFIQGLKNLTVVAPKWQPLLDLFNIYPGAEPVLVRAHRSTHPIHFRRNYHG